MYKNIILIPIGGIGKRFKINNYKKPKSLINIFGRPILYYLLDNLQINKNTLVYIIYNHEYRNYNLESTLQKDFPNIIFAFYCLHTETRGACETINIGLKNINLDYDCPILCLDCDNFYTENIIQKWDGKTAIFYVKDTNTKPIYSYLNIDEKNFIISIKEKDKISDNACSGAYGFSSYKILLEYSEKTLKTNMTVNNEFYTSSCISIMIDNNIDFEAVEVKRENYHCLGTPFQMKQFYNNKPHSSCLTDKITTKKIRVCFDLDNTLVTFPLVKNDYTTVEPITKNIEFLRYLKKSGNTIIIHTARRMQSCNGDVGKVLANVGKITFDTLEKFNIPYDEIYFGKPNADFYIDDKGVSSFDDLEKELGYYIDNIDPRSFNSIKENTIEIYTKHSDDLSGEIYYYKNIPREIKDLFPIFIDYDDNNKSYSIEKIYGLTLTNMYMSNLLTPSIFKHILLSIKRIQNVEISELNKKINIYSNYKDKLKERFDNYDYSIFPNYLETYQSLYDELKKYEEQEKGKISCIHGDPVFSNIIINQYEKIKFIDMRGKVGNECTIYGDWLYDWAKIYQSLIGYDEILMKKEIDKEYKSEMIEIFENFFTEWFSNEDLKNLKLITNSLLFSLIPLHNNDKCEKYYNLIDLKN